MEVRSNSRGRCKDVRIMIGGSEKDLNQDCVIMSD